MCKDVGLQGPITPQYSVSAPHRQLALVSCAGWLGLARNSGLLVSLLLVPSTLSKPSCPGQSFLSIHSLWPHGPVLTLATFALQGRERHNSVESDDQPGLVQKMRLR